MKIWYDITNTPQVHFLLAIINGLKEEGFDRYMISARDFSETVNFLKKQISDEFTVIGDHKGGSMSKKIAGLLHRFKEINRTIKEYDLSISCGSEGAIWSSFLKRKHSIAFGDNDLARQWTYAPFVDFAFFPNSISKRVLTKQGLWNRKLYQYNGLKEHIYIADYKPDKEFLCKIPFESYVVVRPENIQANYVQGEEQKSITPELLKLLSSKGHNIIFLPRYSFDRTYAEGIKNIFIPSEPMNGLDLCYYSEGVFTGAGTFAREAACLGVPSFSFFLGESLLAVDRSLVKEQKMYFSRNPVELVENFIKSHRSDANLSKVKEVRQEVIFKTIEVINKF